MSTPMFRRASRRDLALSRPIWLATGSMYAAMAVGATAVVLTTSGLPIHRLQLTVVALMAIGVVHLTREPPPIGSLANHVVLLSVSANLAVALWAAQPGGSLAIGGALFIGPLIAVRLQRRRHIAAHLGASTAMLGGLALAGAVWGIVDGPTIMATLLIVVATWVLCSSCTIVLEAAEAQGDELERLVRRDPLTGVGNRRLFDERVADELRRHERMQRPLSLLTLDLNGFKALNDRVGHAAGDDLLRAVAGALCEVTGDPSSVVRQDGDEFCLILPETSPVIATRTANAVRAALASIDVQGNPVEAGIGIGSYPDDAVDASVLLHVADERLRANKLAAPSRPSIVSSGRRHA